MSSSHFLISTQTAALLTGKSMRTIQRWREDGSIESAAPEGEQRRAGDTKFLIHLPGLAAYLPLELDAGLMAQVVAADRGDPDAINAVALRFFGAGHYEQAAKWFECAAVKGHADAMDWLGVCYLRGLGVSQSRILWLRWLADAAAHGHRLAAQKIAAIQLDEG